MNLSTRYMGLSLPHPLIAGASPLSDDLDTIRRLEDAGAAAIVMRSLFEEQLTREQLSELGSVEYHEDSFGEALSFLPEAPRFALGPDAYLEHIHRVKSATGIPIIASLNGSTPGGWLHFGRLLAGAGADGLELNVYQVPSSRQEDALGVEDRVVAMVDTLREHLQVPIAVKLSPYYSAPAHLAARLAEAGADALVLFNRFYQPDIDLERLEVSRVLHLSDSRELPLRLRWLAVLFGRVTASLAVTGGVHRAEDALKAVMAGADGVQMVSALLRHGAARLTAVRDGMAEWLEEHEYESLAQAHGSMSLDRCPDPAGFERANYIQILQTWT